MTILSCIRFDINGDRTADMIRTILHNVVSKLTEAEVNLLLEQRKQQKMSINEKFIRNRESFESNDKENECWKSLYSDYENIFKYYDMDDGLQLRGGYMRLTPMQLLKFHIPSFKDRLFVIKKIVEYNSNGFMGHTTSGKCMKESVDGGTNTPIAIQSQLMLAILICNLFHEYSPSFKGIIMVNKIVKF